MKNKCARKKAMSLKYSHRSFKMIKDKRVDIKDICFKEYISYEVKRQTWLIRCWNLGTIGN